MNAFKDSDITLEHVDGVLLGPIESNSSHPLQIVVLPF